VIDVYFLDNFIKVTSLTRKVYHRY